MAPRSAFNIILVCCITWIFILLCQAEVLEKSDTDAPRLIAVSDLHGDIYVCREVLRAAGIIDKDDHWIGGRSTVVQLGDIADRGAHPHEIYDFFYFLEKEAAAAGGEFIFLIGNHELMNLVGDFRYVHSSVVDVFGGPEAYASAFSPAGAYGSLILRHPVTVVRDGVVFVHAGIMPEYALLGVNAINDEFLKGFQALSPQQKSGGTLHGELPHPFKSMDSPVWSRRVLSEAAGGNCSLLDESLRLLSLSEAAAGKPPVHVMIGGHTIQMGGAVSVLCNGRLVAADVGLSRYLSLKSSHLAYVEFVLDNAASGKRRVPQPKYLLESGYKALIQADNAPSLPRFISLTANTKSRRSQFQNEGAYFSPIFFLPLLLVLTGVLLVLFRSRRIFLRRYVFGGNRKEF